MPNRLLQRVERCLNLSNAEPGVEALLSNALGVLRDGYEGPLSETFEDQGKQVLQMKIGLLRPRRLVMREV
jgi:hypothetical protein